MSDLFTPHSTDNLLPHDGQLYNLGLLDLSSLAVNDLYQILLTSLPWQSDIVTLFGKTHITKRQIVWMGDPGLSYHYSGHTREATEWHSLVFHVKQLIEENISSLNLSDYSPQKDEFQSKDNHQKFTPYFNACLLNYYPSGSEGMGYHADDEKELGDQPLIAALSLGATRKMLFRAKQANHKEAKYKEAGHKKTQDKVDLHLASGQLIVMAGVTQQYWRHSIAKTTKVSKGRISLTFRNMLTS